MINLITTGFIPFLYRVIGLIIISVFYFVFRDALTGNVVARLSFVNSGLPYTNDRIKNGEVLASGIFSSDEGKNIYELHCYLHAFLLQTPYSKSFMKVRNESLKLYRKPQPRSVIEKTKEEEDAIDARYKAEEEEFMKEQAEEDARIEARAREAKDEAANWDKDEFETTSKCRLWGEFYTLLNAKLEFVLSTSTLSQ